MATPFGNAQDTGIDTNLAPLDWSFLNFAMQKKEAQYESGLNKVQSMYSSILNSPLSNTENQQVRSQYLNEAKSQIQNLGKADLSLPQNVRAAQGVFAPFWQDNELVADMAATKHLQSEIDRGVAARNSSDPNVRDTYDESAIKYLQWHQQDLKTAKRGDGSIPATAGNATQALWTPFLDVSEYAAKLLKEEGIKDMNFTNASGPSLITEHNGPKSVSLYKTWLAGAMGTKFDPQFKVMGYVRYRDEMANYMSQNPGVSMDQAKHIFAQNKFNEINTSYSDRINQTSKDIYTNYTKPLEELKAQIAPVVDLGNGNKTGGATPQQIEQLNKLQSGYDSYTSMLGDLKQEHDKFNRDKDKTIANIQSAPDNYYGSLEKENAINNWAQHKASAYTVDIDVNKAWEAVDQSQRGWQTLAETQRHNLADEAIQTQKEKDKMGTSTNTSTISGGVSVGDNIDYLGKGTTDVQHVGNPMEVLRQIQNEKLANATVSYFNQNGVSGVLSNYKISDKDLMHFNTLMRRVTGPDAPKEYTPTQDQYTALMNVKHTLQNILGDGTPLNTYTDIRNALSNLVTKEAISKNGIFAPNDPLLTAYGAYKNASQNLNEYNQIEDQRKKFIQSNLLKNKTKYGVLLNDAGTDVANTNDYQKTLEKYLFQGNEPKTIQVIENPNMFGQGTQKTLKPEDLANAYANNQLFYNPNGDVISIGDKKYKVIAVGNRPNQTQYIEHGMVEKSPMSSALDGLITRYGTYDQKKQLNQEIANKIPDNVSLFKDRTGKLGSVFGYEYGTDKDPGPGLRVVRETTNPGNILKITDQDGNDLTKYIGELGGITSDNKSIRENVEQPKIITISESGRPMVEYTVVNNAETKKNAPNLSGKHLKLEMSPSMQGTVLSTIPNSPGLQTYQKLYEGKTIDSDDLDQSVGYKYHITPDVSENPTSATVSIEKKVVNPKDGSIKWVPYRTTIQLANRTPDEIMKEINQDIYANVLQNSQNQSTYNSTNGTGMSLADWENSRKAK